MTTRSVHSLSLLVESFRVLVFPVSEAYSPPHRGAQLSHLYWAKQNRWMILSNSIRRWGRMSQYNWASLPRGARAKNQKPKRAHWVSYFTWLISLLLYQIRANQTLRLTKTPREPSHPAGHPSWHSETRLNQCTEHRTLRLCNVISPPWKEEEPGGRMNETEWTGDLRSSILLNVRIYFYARLYRYPCA